MKAAVFRPLVARHLLLGAAIVTSTAAICADATTRVSSESAYDDGSADQARVKAWLDAHAAQAPATPRLGALRVRVAFDVTPGTTPDWARHTPVPQAAQRGDEVVVLSCLPGTRTEWRFQAHDGAWGLESYRTSTTTACDVHQPMG